MRLHFFFAPRADAIRDDKGDPRVDVAHASGII
jgi:hypothetical protein